MTKLIPIDDIIAGTNVRKEHDDEISELATSIERIGLQNALVVVKTESGKYRIISGHRRFLACKRLGLHCLYLPFSEGDTPKKMVQN